jgi:predicted phosphodiesterase
VRLHIVSDLHLEFGVYALESADADVLVLAGDVGLREAGVKWAAAEAQGRPVIYVPGNHEYYGSSLPRLAEKLRTLGAPSRVHVLDREKVEIDGVRFYGATLWTDFGLLGDPVGGMAAARGVVVDYRRIRVSPGYRKLRPQDTASIHAATRRWLAEEIARGGTPGAVIVSHHAPSKRSIAPQFLTDPVSASYASHLDDLVERSGAALWVHGHTHNCVDYAIGSTRVVSNQRGYVDELVSGFRPRLVVEVACG